MALLDKSWVACGCCAKQIFRRTWHPGKHRPITQSFCDNKCKGDWQRAQKPYTKEWLTKKYITEGLSADDIALIVGRDPKRVWEWIRDYGIETRRRGTYEKNQFQKGHLIWVGKTHKAETKEKIRAASIKDGRVPYLTKDGQHYMKGRRGRDHHGWMGGLTPERERVAQTDEWKSAVKIVWARADARCEFCNKDHRPIDRDTESFDIHHIISFQYRPARCAVDNLVLLCERCHYFVHSKANGAKLFMGEIPNE